MSERPVEQPEKVRDLADRITERSAQITFENMEKLCNQKEYEIAGHTYKRKILKPKELVELFQLQKSLDKVTDPEKRFDILYKEANICLEGITPELWEETDAVMMEQVVSACLLISRGFRTV